MTTHSERPPIQPTAKRCMPNSAWHNLPDYPLVSFRLCNPCKRGKVPGEFFLVLFLETFSMGQTTERRYYMEARRILRDKRQWAVISSCPPPPSWIGITASDRQHSHFRCRFSTFFHMLPKQHGYSFDGLSAVRVA